jgi:hypothetical protein
MIVFIKNVIVLKRRAAASQKKTRPEKQRNLYQNGFSPCVHFGRDAQTMIEAVANAGAKAKSRG